MVVVLVPTVAPKPPALHCMEHSKAVVPTHPVHQVAEQATHAVSATELQAKIDLLNDQQFDSVVDFLMPDLGDSEGQVAAAREAVGPGRKSRRGVVRPMLPVR